MYTLNYSRRKKKSYFWINDLHLRLYCTASFRLNTFFGPGVMKVRKIYPDHIGGIIDIQDALLSDGLEECLVVALFL